MTRHLIVAHQTAESDELRDAALELARREPDAEFTLLVPATPVNHLLVWDEGETAVIAQRRAESASSRLRADGVNVVDARVGDPDPFGAVADELLRQPGYTTLLVGTLPARLSHWLRIDLISRLRRHADGREIIHVVAHVATPARELSHSR